MKKQIVWSFGITKPEYWTLIPWIVTYKTVDGWRFSWGPVVIERVAL